MAFHQVGDRIGADVKFAPPEMHAVLERGMRADGHIVLQAQRDGVAHRLRIACVSTTGDAGRTDQRHDGRIVAASFAEVAVENELRHDDAGQGVGAGVLSVVAGIGATTLAGAAGAVLAFDAGDGATAVAGAVHSLASGLPPSICARTSGIGGPP